MREGQREGGGRREGMRVRGSERAEEGEKKDGEGVKRE